jgi:hypothetical protein
MIFYEWNMLIGDELILPLLHKHDRMQDMKTWKGCAPWTLMGEK